MSSSQESSAPEEPEQLSSADNISELAVGGGIRAGILLRGGLSIAARASAFGASIVLIRVVGAEGAGSFFFVMSLGVVLGLLLAAGLGEAMGREIPKLEMAKKLEESGPLLFAALKIGGFVCAAASAVTVLLTSQIGVEQAAPIVSALLIGVGLAAQAVGGSFLRARGRFTSAELWQGAAPTLFLVSVGLLAVSIGVEGVAALRIRIGLEVMAGAGAVGCAIAIARGKKRWAGAERVVRVLKLSAPLWVTNACWLILQQSDVVALGLLRGSHQVGLYVPILKMAEISALPLVAMTPYLVTRAARFRYDPKRLQGLVNSSTRWSFALASPLLAVLVLAPRELIDLVFGIDDKDVASVARLLGVAFVALALVGASEPILQGVGRVRLLAARSLWILVGAVAINLALVARFGTVGAAGGTAIAYVALACFNLAVIRTRYGVRLFEIEARKVVASAAGSALVAWVALRVVESAMLSVVVAGGLVGLATLGVALKLEGLSPRGVLGRATSKSSVVVEVGRA